MTTHSFKFAENKGLFEECNTLPEQKDQKIPAFDEKFPRDNTWHTHTYTLTDLKSSEKITGIEELTLFIMNGGCHIVWLDKNLEDYCKRSKDNFAYVCRYIGWSTLGASASNENTATRLKQAYDTWCKDGVVTNTTLNLETADCFDWSFDRWGACSWSTEVLLAD